MKIAVVVMGVLIVAGTGALLVEVVRRVAGQASGGQAGRAGPPAAIEAVLEEPAGTRIVGIATLPDRLAVHLQGGGVDRVVLIDTRSGGVAGRIALAH